jgi:ketosteroid isomerase-like protein
VGPNSELLLAGYDAWNHNDLDAWIERLDPDVEISTSGMFPDLASEYRGHERAAKFWNQMHEPWESFSIEVEHVEDQGDWAIASIRFRGCGKDSGVEVDMRFGMAMRMHDGKAMKLVNRPNFDEARKAVPAQRARARPSR